MNLIAWGNFLQTSSEHASEIIKTPQHMNGPAVLSCFEAEVKLLSTVLLRYHSYLTYVNVEATSQISTFFKLEYLCNNSQKHRTEGQKKQSVT